MKKNKKVFIQIIEKVEVKSLQGNIKELNYKDNVKHVFSNNRNSLIEKIKTFKESIDSRPQLTVIKPVKKSNECSPKPVKTIEIKDTTKILNNHLIEIEKLRELKKNDSIEKSIYIQDNVNLLMGTIDGHNICIKGIQVNNDCWYDYLYTEDKNKKIERFLENFVKEYVIKQVLNNKTKKSLKDIFSNNYSYAYGLYFKDFDLTGKNYSVETLEKVLDNYINNKFYLQYDMVNIYDGKIGVYNRYKYSSDNINFDLKTFKFDDYDKLEKFNHLSDFIEILSIFYHNIKTRFSPENIAINELLKLEECKTINYSKDGLNYTNNKELYGLSMYRIFNTYIKEFKAKYLKYKNKIYDLTVFQ